MLDFFAGSGTVGRVCIDGGRHCLMCDSNKSSIDYFNRHLELMRELGQNTDYIHIDNAEEFFTNLKGEQQDERETAI